MAKEGQQLWDDSALINAFDHAISTYKKMHGKGQRENSTVGGGRDVKSSNGDATASSADATVYDDISHSETVGNGIIDGSHTIEEVEEGEKSGTAKENKDADSQLPGEHALGSNSLPIQDQSQNISSSTDTDEYNELYKQYYEVEEQRQKILQKLQHLSGWNYQYPGEAPMSGLQGGTTSATQEHQSSISQLPCGTMVVSCCPCACQCSMASCSSAAICAGTGCIGPLATIGNQLAVEDGDIVKTAMGAAERAISTLKGKTSDWKEENKIDDGRQSASPETDLSVVLNAWYSAGFYTGKYLTEQSLAKKQHS